MIEPESSHPSLEQGHEKRWDCNQARAELVLSRPAYHIGGTVVGTVQLISPTFTRNGGSVTASSHTDTSHNANDNDIQPQANADGEITARESIGRYQSQLSGDNTDPEAAETSTEAQAEKGPIAPPLVSHPRSTFTSAQLYVAGRCRIDPRWHNSQSLAQLYGTHPYLSALDPAIESTAVDSYFGERNDGVHVEGGTTVCFWATNVVDLLQLEERGDGGSWENLRPKPLKLGGVEWMKASIQGSEMSEHDAQDDNEEERNRSRREDGGEDAANPLSEKSLSKLEEKQMAFSFRADIPIDVPPSAKAACARYFYSAVVCAQTNKGESIIVQAPFAVVSGRSSSRIHAPQPEVIQSAGRVKIGTCTAIAHSNGLPCYISATAMIRPSKISVNRNVGLCSRATASDVRSLRVTDQAGSPCCILTLVGGEIMYPGGRALVQFDFREDLLLVSRQSAMSVNPLLPCHQVSVSLEGEEVACYDDGSRRKTRTYMFDSAYSAVETGYTDSVSLSLALPLDCPCSLRTDLVEIKIICKVEITVERQGGEGFDILRLELPCEVVQDTAEDNGDGGDEEDSNPQTTVGIMPWEQASGEDDAHGGFDASDIMHDLKMLSLRMIDSIS